MTRRRALLQAAAKLPGFRRRALSLLAEASAVGQASSDYEISELCLSNEVSIKDLGADHVGGRTTIEPELSDDFPWLNRVFERKLDIHNRTGANVSMETDPSEQQGGAYAN